MDKKLILKKMRSNIFFIIGSLIVLILIFFILIAPKIIIFDPEAPMLAERFAPPDFSQGFKGHILGADSMGRDMLTRLLIGGRYSLTLAFVCVFFATLIGTILGLISGYHSGWVDNLIMRIGDMQLSINATLLAVTMVAVLGPSYFNLGLVLIITSWIRFARLIRGNVLVIRNVEFVLAAKALGASNTRIMFNEILPNVLTPILILASQQIGFMILMEAGLSFLGLGVQPPTPSWGGMIAESRQYLTVAPWTVLAPGFILMITVLGFNFLGDGLRDVFDPKMKS